MAREKSTKHVTKVPKFEDYKPSFVTGEGEDREIDIDAALKALHTLMLDKAKEQDRTEDVKAELGERTTERDELQAKVDDKNAPDAQVEIGKANDRAAKAEARAAEAELRADRLEVASEKGLTAKQAKYLPKAGTREELETAADEILVDFPETKVEESDEEREDDEGTGRQSPRPPVVNGSDPKLGQGGNDGIDFEAWADGVAGRTF